MKIFIDFDDVIFNTKQFGEDLKNFFVQEGISEEIFRKHYYDKDDNNVIKLFNPAGLFERLEKYEKRDVSKLRINFSLHLKDLAKFVFDDVESFLTLMGKENVYLISFGLPAFQNEKIVGAGIDKLVNGCVVTSSSKAEAIRQVILQMKIDTNEKIVFIDDRVEQIEDIKKAFPDAHTFFLCRKEGRYCDKKNQYCDWEIGSLKEAQDIIFKI